MEAAIIPIRLEEKQDGGKVTKWMIPESKEDITLNFKDLGLKESVLEEFVRRNIDLVFPDEEQDLLIIGQQTKNKEAGRSDLVALDGDGNIVLMELKRDENDMVRREEAFEFQAVRYASNFALIKTPAEVAELFANYIHKYRSEFDEPQGWTGKMIAEKRLEKFMLKTKAGKSFNNRQRIVLIASSFDPQTISACAWLSRRGIDLRCLVIRPMRHKDQLFLKIQQIIPVESDEQLFVGVDTTSKSEKTAKATGEPIVRTKLPRMPWFFEQKLLKRGDKLLLRGQDAEPAEAIDEKRVKFNGEEMTYNEWGQKVTGWSAICIYEWAFLESSPQKTLDDLRRERMADLSAVSGNS